MFFLAQIFTGIGSLINIAAMQMRKKNSILLCFMTGGTFVGIGFLCLKAYSGAIVCFIGTIQTIINILYNRKNKELPKILIPIYMLSFIVAGVFTVEDTIGTIPVLANLIYVITIIQKKESNIRKLNIPMAILWGTYSVFTGAYPVVISNTFILISTIIGIIRYDVFKQEKELKT